MSLASASVDRWKFTTLTTVIFLLGGVLSFIALGKLEDPTFTVKTAVVSTVYPGASPAEVELEVTDRIEIALQEMPQVKELESYSRAGLSSITVTIWPSIPSPDLPQVWDEIRKKVRDVRSTLPPGAGKPEVSDDFGDVYGFLMAVVGDGYTDAELESYVDSVKKELSLVKDVARVELWGVQSNVIYLDVKQSRLSQLGLAMDDVAMTLQDQNTVVFSGGVDLQGYRLRIQTTGEFESPDDIGDLVVHGASLSEGSTGELIRIRDFADVRRGYVEPATTLMRYNGQKAIGLYASNLPGTNIVNIGAGLDERIAELEATLPVGIEIRRVSWQSDLVSESINAFMISLLQAVAIVVVVLALSMGLRTSIVVGLCGLVFVIFLSFMVMKLLAIDLQRMSLGALIIAMGMMVDNAIVVADGALVRLQKGMSRVQAAVEAATLPSMPLFGATVIASLTFYPIAASDENAGEFCVSLFYVVGIALMISWVLSVTVTPLLCIALLPEPKSGADAKDPYDSFFFRSYGVILRLTMKYRELVLIVTVALLGLTFVGFGHVGKLFFPSAARAQFRIDFWGAEGTRIQKTSSDLAALEKRVMALDGVTAVSAFIGGGPPRFYLPVDPESPNSSYGQLIVNTVDPAAVDHLMATIEEQIVPDVAEGKLILRKFGIGPFEVWPVEAKISGPAIADLATLRRLGEQVKDVMEASPLSEFVRLDWRHRTQKLVLGFDERNARLTSISRGDVSQSTRRAYDGLPVGEYRERDKILPIQIRHTEAERERLATDLEFLQVRSGLRPESVPLIQVLNTIDIEWEDPMIWRWDRRRAITVGAVPKGLATKLLADVRSQVEAIPLPPGYSLMWDGEYRSSGDSQRSLIPGMVPAFILVVLIIMALFNAFRPTIIILATVPFVLIGVVAGLLITGENFGFVALLGTMSLAGMMIKNGIVLLDQAKIESEAGKTHYEAITAAAISRLRPVVLAAATTVLGVMPLLPDVFWVSLAVAIMFGLSFGTVLTMIVIPALYSLFYRLPRSPPGQVPETPKSAPAVAARGG